MATNRPTTLIKSKRDSTQSRGSLWEKFYEPFPETQQNAPFANNEKVDSFEQNHISDDDEDYGIDSDATPSMSRSEPKLNITDSDATPSISRSESMLTITDSDATPSISRSESKLNINEHSKPWEDPTPQDQLKIILNDDNNFSEVKRSLKKDFSRQGLQWTNEEEEVRPWHFGLTSIHLQFQNPQRIDLQMLRLASRIPFLIKLKTEKQKNTPKKNTPIKPDNHRLPADSNISLRYGALTDLNQFYYSPKHSWTNNTTSIWSFSLDDQRNGGGYIEWIIEERQMQKKQKKQLLVTNIDQSIIIDSNPEGFDIYICQKCNLNEFEANGNMTGNIDHNTHKPALKQNKPNPNRDSGKPLQQGVNRRISNPPNLVSYRSPRNEPQQPERVFYEHYHRIGQRADCYFPTVQFSLRIPPPRSTKNNSPNIENQIKQKLAILIEFFLAHKIAVCYGKINSDRGPDPYLFFQPNLPNFPTRITKYSWQILSSVGYRLQLQIDEEFLQSLFELHTTEENADELFYRVCVYLSRIFSRKPFLNINQELQNAVKESKRKRDATAYGLVRKIDIDGDNEAYVPSVTLTPTTIRIKPLKLCRTNRVLRAVEQFGGTLEHFALVDIRDENGRDLQSYHFRDLHPLLLDYLKNGFTLMGDGREYKYLHHSQSQLRARQFWFYHHDKEQPNLSFSAAYRWMGNFDKEKNPAKHAARIALCFSTTRATVEVPIENVRLMPDIMTKDRRLAFTDGCGTMSIELRNQIKSSLGIRNDFSAVQFRYDGAKGVVSVYSDIPEDVDLCIRPSMKKFDSEHTCFEVSKLSAPRPLFLNRQAILLLSYRQIPDASFLVLQQQNHLSLIRALLRNSDAEKLILQKIPFWFLPKDIHQAKIDYIHEPFFRQLLITACSISARELLQRTRIRIPPNEGRNMIGIVDEYNLLKPDQVYIQYTILIDRDSDDDSNNGNKKTKILNNCKVVITKNPCHHPGDIRTFTAVDHPELKHLKDVVVFSQQGDRPAPHDISGSDLDGDEYLVLWHKDLVPYHTENAPPYDYDSQTPAQTYHRSVTRDAINDIILNIAEQDCLGRLSNLHLAFADKFGVDSKRRPVEGVLSTVELAGAISREVDSGKTGDHPLNENDIKILNNALGKERPDYMDNPNFEQYKSDHILGNLYRASKRTIPGWNRLIRYHRHLRHLQVRTRDEPAEDKEEDEQTENNEEETNINVDRTLVAGVNRDHPAYAECAAFADQLASLYRQEVFEILNLYGLSHESDLWCRNSTTGLTGELEDTAYTELEQLAARTRTRFYYEQILTCEKGGCQQDMPVSELCLTCKKRQQSITVACYYTCYGVKDAQEQAPILSLPWLFAGSLLQDRISTDLPPSEGLLSTAMKGALTGLVYEKRRLMLSDTELKFRSSNNSLVKVAVDITVCLFIEVLQQYLGSKNYSHWSFILSRFLQTAPSISSLSNPSDEWELILEPHQIDDEDIYAAILLTIDWTETTDELMHNYFQDMLNICFEQGHRTNDIGFLNISESIILLLQKLAIKETIF